MTDNNPLRARLAWLALIPLAASSAPAQVVGGGGGSGSGNEHPPQQVYPISAPGTGAITRSATGDYDADGFPDFAMLRDGSTWIASGPGSNPWWLQSANDAADLATRPGAGGDSLLTVGPGGICEHATPGGALSSTALETSAWLGAQLVDCGLTLENSVLEERIVGVLAGGTSIAVLSPDGLGGWTSTTLTLSPALPGPAVDLVLTDVDGNQELEITVATASALKSYDLEGNQVFTLTVGGYSTTSLAKGFKGGSCWVAWTSKKNGSNYLLTVDQTGATAFAQLGTGLVKGAAAVSWSDANDDLALSLATGELWILHDTGPLHPTFSTNNYTAVDLEVSSFVGLGQPAVADVDLDGDLDVLVPTRQTGGDKVLIARNAEADHTALQVEIEESPESLSGPFAAFEDPNCGAEPNTQIKIGFQVHRPTGSASAANEITLSVWKQADPTNTGGMPGVSWTTNPMAITSQLVVPFLGNDATLYFPMEDPDNGAGCGIAAVATNHMYYVQVQLREVQGSTVVQTWPPKLLGLQTQAYFSNNRDYQDGLKAPGTAIMEIVYLDVEASSGQPEPVYVGTVNEMTELPNLGPGLLTY